jgi:hypothetical protein
MNRWRGLKSLVVDAVEHGSRAVEHVQKETARRPFEILAKLAPLEVPVKGIQEIHDTAVSGIHGMIRLVTRVVGGTVDVVIDVVERRRERAAHEPLAAKDPPPEAEPPPDPTA